MNNLCEFLGEPEPTNLRKCIKCGEHKSLDNFGFRSYGKNGTQTEQRNDCNQCRTEQRKKLDKIKKYHPLPDLKTYRCPHCNRSQEEIFKTGSWINTKKKTCFIPDHDHDTGEFRGYICDDCNTVIARAKENVNTLRNIADFLEKRLTNPAECSII
jgi:hypothetical protein